MNTNILVGVLKDYSLIALVAAIIGGYIINALSGSRKLGIVAGVIIALFILILPYNIRPKCEQCNETMVYGEKYCSDCGYEQETGNFSGKIECPKCDRRIDKDSNTCSYCGVNLHE